MGLVEPGMSAWGGVPSREWVRNPLGMIVAGSKDWMLLFPTWIVAALKWVY